MRADLLRRVLLLGLGCLVLALDSEAQGGKGKRKRPGGRPPAGASGARKDQPPPLIPGLGQPGKTPVRGTKPTSAKPKVVSSKPPAAVDPMKQADLVTQSADQRARLELEQAALVGENFGLCDLDGNGWISLREGTFALALSREEYGRADQNRDGRLDPAEFQGQKELVLTRLGVRRRTVGEELEPSAATVEREPDAAAQPALLPGATEAPGREAQAPPAQGPPMGPSAPEFSAQLPPSAHIQERHEGDHSAGLKQQGENEPAPIVWLATQNGEVLPRAPEAGEAPVTERVPLPVPLTPARPPTKALVPPGWTHFGLLDADLDGFIDEGDLRVRQSPARLDLRLTAVLSAMDADGDGRLSETEFRRSMSTPPR